MAAFMRYILEKFRIIILVSLYLNGFIDNYELREILYFKP